MNHPYAQTRIVITLQYEATHNWPGCDIEGVMFLKHEHRHIFHITCKKVVLDDDRAIEIIRFKHDVTQYLTEHYGKKFGSKSCEMIARELMNVFLLDECQVLEDGENGADIRMINL